MEKLKEMTNDELGSLLVEVKKEIESRVTVKKVLFNAEDYFERYNGGWCKSISGLNKSKTDGYSIIGDFMGKKTEWFIVGNLYLDCGIGGSRKNQYKNYNLFTLDEDANVIEIKYVGNSRSWATEMWEAIESYKNPNLRN